MFILWYSASSTFGKDSDIVMGVRAQQKEKTRRSLVEAAFSQLSAERSFASLSLREVAREAGIAPTSFYRHFRDVDELGSDHGLMRAGFKCYANSCARRVSVSPKAGV